MAVTAISGLTRILETTVPIAVVDDVPVGLSFVMGYGQDRKLVNFCNSFEH